MRGESVRKSELVGTVSGSKCDMDPASGANAFSHALDSTGVFAAANGGLDMILSSAVTFVCLSVSLNIACLIELQLSHI